MIISLDITTVNRNSGVVELNSNMPTKKESLFDVSGKEPAKPKLPTIRQYLRENKNVTSPIVASVTVIWFPGNWDNYSVETGKFRTSIAPGHPLYDLLDRDVIAITEASHTGIALSLEDSDGTIRFCETTNYGKWERIGNSGIRFRGDGTNEPS